MDNQNTLKFLVIYHDPDYSIPFTEDEIQAQTTAHVDGIRDLDVKGILHMCALLKGTEKAMLILNAKTYEEAESYILKDPFIINKIYKYTITELVEANADNNYLLGG